MAAPFTAAAMAAATRRYGYTHGSEFDDGVRVGPTFPGFVSNEVAANTSLAGVPTIQTNCPPLDDCQSVMGYGSLLSPIYSYNITAKGVAADRIPTISLRQGNNYIGAGFLSVLQADPANVVNNQVITLDKVLIQNKLVDAWVFDWPRAVMIAKAGNVVTSAHPISVYGIDMYGQPMKEDIIITNNGGADPVYQQGTKAFKAIIGVSGTADTGAIDARGAVTLSPSNTVFGLPYFTTSILSVYTTQTVDGATTFTSVGGALIPPNPFTPFRADATVAANWYKDGTDLTYTPVLATGTGDVRGLFLLPAASAIVATTPIVIQAYCPGFDNFLKQQIVNRSPYGSYAVPVGVPGAGNWVTIPAPSWLLSPQTQYGVKQYWGNPVI